MKNRTRKKRTYNGSRIIAQKIKNKAIMVSDGFSKRYYNPAITLNQATNHFHKHAA